MKLSAIVEAFLLREFDRAVFDLIERPEDNALIAHAQVGVSIFTVYVRIVGFRKYAHGCTSLMAETLSITTT